MSRKFDDLQDQEELQELDEWLGSGFLSPPADFTDRVMRRVQALPLPSRRPQVKNTLIEFLKWLGAAELVMFIFGIWITTAAA